MTWASLRTFSLLLAVAAIVASCSSDSKNFFGKGYHNTTARYNAFFLAELRMEKVEDNLQAAHEDDYNKILRIYPTVTPALSTASGALLEDIIKKASLPITRHKNSKWVDDSYILIGKARRYKLEYPEAVATFKYVNTTSEDLDDRHHALVELMRTFMVTKEMDNATAVVDYLNKEKIGKKNKAKFYKAKAEYFYLIEEYEKAAISLRFAVQDISDHNERARMQFIIAQLYQKIGKENRAYVHYNLTLKNNPAYELSFFAKLYLAQTYQKARGDDIKKIRKYFDKLLEDEKNVEYRDKIYYEMAKFDLKQELVGTSLADLRKSLDNSKENIIQKGYSYLMSGEIYYDRRQNFSMAKLYYDSAVAVLPKDLEGYKEIERRQKILTAFVQQYEVVQTEDSLQRMAAMGKPALTAMLQDKYRAQQEKEEEERVNEEKEKRRLANLEANRKDDNPFEGPSELPGVNIPGRSSFYFANAKAISKGQKDFTRIWGDRPLEDNWRRLTKANTYDDDDSGGQDLADVTTAQDDDAPREEEPTEEEAAKTKEDVLAAERSALVSGYLAKVPFTEPALAASHAKLMLALYNLGKIYDQQLNEPKNAIVTFERLLTDYPEFEKTAEVLYFLYVLYGKTDPAKAGIYKNRLIAEFPDSDYAKVILNPNFFAEQRELNSVAKRLYKEAYELSEQGFYTNSTAMADNILRDYPESDFDDQLMLLKALNTGKGGDIDGFRQELIAFIANYPKSELLAFAQKMLSNTDAFIKRQLTGDTGVAAAEGGEPVSEAMAVNRDNFTNSFNKQHFFVMAISNQKVNTNQLQAKFSDFSKVNFSGKSQNLVIFNDIYQFLAIRDFTDREQAMQYFAKATSTAGPMGDIPQSDYQVFVISTENYAKLLPLKSLDSYMQFFRNSYLK